MATSGRIYHRYVTISFCKAGNYKKMYEITLRAVDQIDNEFTFLPYFAIEMLI